MSQHTVIVGGTAGIGLATARRLAAEGHQVTVIGRDADRVKQAVAEIGGEDAQGHATSMTDRAALEAVFAEIAPFNHLVITAPGTGAPGTLADLDLEALEEAFHTKFSGLAHAIQARQTEAARIERLVPVEAPAATTGAAAAAALRGRSHQVG